MSVRRFGWHPRLVRYAHTRRRVARQLIRGEGLEIGALHNPFPVPPRARVRYLDHLDADQLRQEYPDLGGNRLVPVDVVDDGETLAQIPDDSQDFVIASHFLEHCEDPIGAIKADLRVIRPGGTLLLALPDRRYGIDRHREPTSLEHVVNDHEHGPTTSRVQHYREWVRLVDVPLGRVGQDDVDEHAAWLEQRGYRIHYHCWTRDEFSDQLQRILQKYRLPARLRLHRMNYHEYLVAVTRDP
jgi:predicted SAM-dependent methyltransferase